MKPDFSKSKDGLLPAVVQDIGTDKVLMLGYMNQDAIDETLRLGKVTFYSRSKERLWTKGEQSGNFLHFESFLLDCDNDAILVKVRPEGAVCHTGKDTCWGERNLSGGSFLERLEKIISQRRNEDADKSYVARLFHKGINKIAQKVGEEAVEMVIEAKDNDEELFLDESADLLFHYLILLQAKGHNMDAVISILERRHMEP